MKRLLAAVSMLSLGIVFVLPAMAQSTIVNHLTMNQWVQTADDGSMMGRVVMPEGHGQVKALANVTVAISDGHGKVVRARSNSKGEFAVKHLKPGVYAVSARGRNAFASCALQVVDRQSGHDRLPNVLEIPMANVDYTDVNATVLRYLPPSSMRSNQSVTAGQVDELAEQVFSRESMRVQRVSGGLKGRLFAAGVQGAALQGTGMTNVFLFRNGQQVARTISDEHGRFQVADLAPGQYALLSVGPGGVGMIGFELTDETRGNRVIQGGSETFTQVQDNAEIATTLAMQVAPAPEVIETVDGVAEPAGACMSVAGPVTVSKPDGSQTEIGEGESVSFFLNAGEEAISDADGNVLYEDVLVVDECPGEEVDSMDDSMGIPLEEIPMDGVGTPLAGGGYGPMAGGGPGFGGGGGGGSAGGGGAGGIGALAGLAAVGAVAASNDDGGFFLTPPPASPATP